MAEVSSDPYAAAIPGDERPVNRCLSFSTPNEPAPKQAESISGRIGTLIEAVSDEAVRKRVERLMKPKADGKFKVPEELIKEWRSGDQKRLLEEFKSAGLDKDISMIIFQIPNCHDRML